MPHPDIQAQTPLPDLKGFSSVPFFISEDNLLQLFHTNNHNSTSH